MTTFKRFERKEQPEKPSAAGRKLRLLYVEDEDINWEVTLAHLRERYQLDRATNAKKAFELMRANVYNAVLMDIQLAKSDYDGIEITQILRGKYEGALMEYARDIPATDIPIVFMTAYTSRYRKSDLISVGGDDLVGKPVDFIHLGLILSRVVLKHLTPLSSGAKRSR